MYSVIYEKALKMGRREMNLRKGRHEDPYLPVLEETEPALEHPEVTDWTNERRTDNV